MTDEKIKLVITDFDGSLVNYPNEPFHASWDIFPEILSKEKREKWLGYRDFYVKKLREAGGDKVKIYDRWFNSQVGLLKNLSLEKVNSAFFPIPYSRGAREFFCSLDGKYIKGILSSGVGFVIERARQELKFDFQYSSDLEIKNKKFTGRGKKTFDFSEKGKEIISLAKKYQINLEEVCYIGDHFNDVSAWEVAGLSVAFNPKERELEKKVNYVIYDFRELNKILKNKKWTPKHIFKT